MSIHDHLTKEELQEMVDAGRAFDLGDGHWLLNTHGPDQCAVETCVLHNPSHHHMSEWPLHWRGDRRMFERICPCGVGHPDPDQVRFWERQFGAEKGSVLTTHGCCGCCAPGHATKRRGPGA